MRLIEKLQADVDAQVEEILSEARKQAAAIEAEADAEIEALKGVARVATRKRLDLEKARRSAKVLHRAKQREAQFKQGLVERAFEAAGKKLQELDEDTYSKLFERLAAEALRDLGKGKLTVSVREGDRARAEAALEAAGAEADIEETLEQGGLVVRSEDTNLFVDGSLETRLQRAYLEGVTLAGTILFAEDAPDGAKE